MNGNFHMIVEQPWDGVFFHILRQDQKIEMGWQKVNCTALSAHEEGVPEEKPLSEVQPQDCPIFKGVLFLAELGKPFLGLGDEPDETTQRETWCVEAPQSDNSPSA